MRPISPWDSNSISTLFSSFNNGGKKAGPLNMGVDLSTLGLIKSGSYHKMLKSYYSDEDKSNLKSTATSGDSTKTIAAVDSSASDMVKSAEKLYKGSDKLWAKDDKGEYDKEAIYKAVSSFVDDYNSLVKSVGKSNTSSIANAGAGLVNNTKVNANMLSKVGIKMDSSNYTLSIDEDTFKKSDMNDVKSIFSGNGSFAYSVGVKASMIDSYAQVEKSKSNTYNNAGNFTYNYNSGEIYNSKW